MLVLSFQTVLVCLVVLLLLLLLKAGQEVFGKRNLNWFPQSSLFLGYSFGKLFCFVFMYWQPFALWSQFSDGYKWLIFHLFSFFYYMNENDDSQVSYTPDQKLEVWFHCFCVLPSLLPSLPSSYFFSHLSSLLSSYGGPPPPFSFRRLCQSGHRANNCRVTLLFSYSGILGRWHPRV